MPDMRNGTTPSQARPSNVSSASPGGKSGRSTKAHTANARKKADRAKSFAAARAFAAQPRVGATVTKLPQYSRASTSSYQIKFPRECRCAGRNRKLASIAKTTSRGLLIPLVPCGLSGGPLKPHHKCWLRPSAKPRRRSDKHHARNVAENRSCRWLRVFRKTAGRLVDRSNWEVVVLTRRVPRTHGRPVMSRGTAERWAIGPESWMGARRW